MPSILQVPAFLWGQKAGVLVSCDNGVTWADFNQGFKDQNGNWFCNDINVRSLIMIGNHLYAGTDCGVWRTSVSLPVSVIEASRDFKRTVVYPNPFTVSATVQFGEEPGNGTLSVFNVMGQKVKALKVINANNVKFERDDLKAGIYFYEISTQAGITYQGKFLIED